MRWTRVYPWIVAAALGGCTGEAQVAVTSPDLVEVQPGVQVVADADQPLFFVDGGYFMYRDGYWLRSDRYDRGFVRVNVVPDRLREVREPQAYVHYRRGHNQAQLQQPREDQQRTRDNQIREQQQRQEQEQRAKEIEDRNRAQDEQRAREQQEQQVREQDQRREEEQHAKQEEQTQQLRATEQDRKQEQRREQTDAKKKQDKRDEH